MTAKEFYEKNRGKYFTYDGEKVRVVGCGFQQVIISTKNGGFELGAIHNFDRLLLNDDDKCLYVNIKDLNPIEQQEINLCEILKGCEGLELWSDICGACKLDKIHKDGLIRVVVCKTESIGFNFLRDGRFYDFEGAKCLLWPSETNRDWSTFKKPIKDDDWVVACDGEGCGHINKYCNINRTWKYVIPFEKYNPTLTDEELNKLSIV